MPKGTPGKYDYKDPGVYTLENDKSIKELGIHCECSGRSCDKVQACRGQLTS